MGCIAEAEYHQSIDVYESIESHPIFKGLPKEVTATFAASARAQHYPKGKILFLQQDKAESFYIIATGWVKLFRETFDGDEAVIDVLNEGCIFGETAIFEDGIHHNSAQSIEDTMLLSLPLSLLKQQMIQSNELSMKMFGAMSRYRRLQDQELEHRDLQSAPQRIGCFLLRLCNQDQLGPITLHLPYDKSLIAARLGMKPETFSRALTRLRRETGIRINGSTVIMDGLSQLTSYSCSACSSTFPCEDIK